MNLYTLYYKLVFRILRIKYGKNLKVYGKIFIEDYKNCTLVIGDNVKIYPYVHFKFYEDTKIFIGNEVKLDSFTRYVVANSSEIRIGDFTKIGKSTVINAGANLFIGSKNLIAQNCSINSSSHNFNDKSDIISQGYNHKKVELEENIWLGANVVINPGTLIEKNTIIGAGCNIKTHIKKNSIVKNNSDLIIEKNENY